MTCHVINNTMLLIGVLLTLFCAGALAQYGDPICVAGDPQVAPCFVCVSFDGTALCGDGETDCYFGIDPFDPACQISPPVYYTDAPVPQCHPDDIPPTLPPIPGLENCQACLNVNTFVKCSGSEEEECTWFPCFYEADPICAAGDELYTCVVCVSLDGTALCAEGETNCNYGLDPTDPACQEAPATGEPMPEEPECVAGDIFPFLPLVGDCWVCINLDETDLCAEGETTCHWGYDPIRPECRVTEPPPPQCHPDDTPPTADFGLEYCCLNVDTNVRCSGEEGEACTWLYCIYESVPPPQCHPDDIPPTAPSFYGNDYCQVCLNVDTYARCSGEDGEACTWLACNLEVGVTEPPPPQCHPDDIPPTDFTGLEYCCLNVDTDVRCNGEDGDACTWKYCILELIPCHPDDPPPTAPPFFPDSCKVCLNVDTYMRCSGEDGELCTLLDCRFEVGNTTMAPISVCGPGDILPVPGLDPECYLECINPFTNESCSNDDVGVGICNWSGLSDECLNIYTLPPTTPQMPICQPGDEPLIDPSIICTKCLNVNDEPCQEGQFCDWKYVDPSQCIETATSPRPERTTETATSPRPERTTETATSPRPERTTSPTGQPPMSLCQPGEEPRFSSEDLCTKCLNENREACQEGDLCDWQVVETSECQRTTPVSSDVRCYLDGRLALKVGETMDNPDDPCNSCVCSKTGDFECSPDQICGKVKRLSVVFETKNCAYILYNDDRREEFTKGFKQQLTSLTGFDAKDITLKCGSIVTDFAIVGTEDDPVDSDAAKRDINKLIRNGKLKVEVDSEEYKAVAVTDISEPKKREKAALGLPMRSWGIIGAVVGVAVLAIVMLIITVCVERAKSRSDSKDLPELDSQYDYAEPEGKLTGDEDVTYDEDIPRNDYVNTGYNQ